MFSEKLNNIKNSLIKVDQKDNKKSIENLVLIAVLLIIVVISINFIWNDDKKKNNKNTSDVVLASKNTSEDARIDDNLEKRLEDILSKINGVGEVKVLITYAKTSSINPVYNENFDESITEEEDTSGGKRTVSSSSSKKEVVSSSSNEIVTKSITHPEIQGAVVIAKGAGNATVKTSIIQAVEAATGLSTYKIQVFEMN